MKGLYYKSHLHTCRDISTVCRYKEWEIKYTPAPKIISCRQRQARLALNRQLDTSSGACRGGERVWKRSFHKVWFTVTWDPSRQPWCLTVRRISVCMCACVCACMRTCMCVCFEMGWVTCCHTLVTTLGTEFMCMWWLQTHTNTKTTSWLCLPTYHVEIPYVLIHCLFFFFCYHSSIPWNWYWWWDEKNVCHWATELSPPLGAYLLPLYHHKLPMWPLSKTSETSGRRKLSSAAILLAAPARLLPFTDVTALWVVWSKF